MNHNFSCFGLSSVSLKEPSFSEIVSDEGASVRDALTWLRPHLGDMRGPVYAYVAVISVMTALAGGAAMNDATWSVPVGAVLFYLSDVFVARDRFVTPSPINDSRRASCSGRNTTSCDAQFSCRRSMLRVPGIVAMGTSRDSSHANAT